MHFYGCFTMCMIYFDHYNTHTCITDREWILGPAVLRVQWQPINRVLKEDDKHVMAARTSVLDAFQEQTPTPLVQIKAK